MPHPSGTQAGRAGFISRLNAPFSLRGARILAPLLFGLLSLFYGADANWDLYNYHLYAPFALLNGKLDIDLAPAGFQGYFNPLLDVPLYWLNLHIPAMVTGFLAGTLHGLIFLPLLGIARIVTEDLPQSHRNSLALLLAIAGCLTPNFLSAVGNGMGDNTTALLNLSAVYLLIAKWEDLATWGSRTAILLVATGIVVGLAVGLKLTNAVFAVAVCAALLISYRGHPILRLRLAFLFGIGVILGTAVTGGYWMLEMWQRFGNPFFPQFGSLFPNELAMPLMVSDTRWLPHGFGEILLWPFIIAVDAHRVGELAIVPAHWPVVYVLALAFAGVWCWRRLAGRALSTLDQRAVFVLAFICIGYIVWMLLFSIIRYTVALEMLMPVAVFLLLRPLAGIQQARKLTVGILALCLAIIVLSGVPTWGHEKWAHPVYHAQLPPFEIPQRATVLMTYERTQPPLPWVAALFPPSVAFVGIGSSFPATDAYRRKAVEIARERGGSVGAIVAAVFDKRAERLASYSRIASLLKLTSSEGGCALLRSAVGLLHARAQVAAGGDAAAVCHLAVRPQERIDFPARDKAFVTNAKAELEKNGFSLDPESCVHYRAGIGSGEQGYQYCRATILPGP